MNTRITEMLSIRYPIIQAPMAGGVTTTELLTAAAEAGVLGMIGAGYMSPVQLKTQIQGIKKITSRPFGVNLFVPVNYLIDQKTIKTSQELLAPVRAALNLPELLELPTFPDLHKTFQEQVKIVIDENIPVCSFTFGLPSEETIHELKKHGIKLVGTATNVKEAISCEQAGMDLIVLQGSEAGGHRGTFNDEDYEDSLIGLMSLIPQVKKQVQLPVIAAGGIMDGRGLVTALHLGAEAVQMGTAFLTTKESGAHPKHKEAILQAAEDETVITRAFSGKPARGIKNHFIEQLRLNEQTLPVFPVQNSLTQDIRKAAATNNNPDYMSLWSGQCPQLARDLTVQELVVETIKQAELLYDKKH
ncbi:NAD(P)H-dependent flavin oxidoreductase [Bacillus pinisoli]|uniref:NAD(P)H-dependent flavin oxidoreductase n=1 Tax=Bacillus pinisoli TaxID=2901866 RepID=UPI001FF16909|nr:nitronate monooxygenase [Bacillus pinisoli]